jgi:hypothetical protein
MTRNSQGPDHTEALLQGLIAECGEMIRGQLRPAMDAAEAHYEKCAYAEAAVSLVKIAARAGEAVARLRGGPGAQTQHRIIVERLSAGGGEGRGE